MKEKKINIQYLKRLQYYVKNIKHNKHNLKFKKKNTHTIILVETSISV